VLLRDDAGVISVEVDGIFGQPGAASRAEALPVAGYFLGMKADQSAEARFRC
jgi:hypothetical protein